MTNPPGPSWFDFGIKGVKLTLLSTSAGEGEELTVIPAFWCWELGMYGHTTEHFVKIGETLPEDIYKLYKIELDPIFSEEVYEESNEQCSSLSSRSQATHQ